MIDGAALMTRTISILLGGILLFAPATSALGWGDDGHQTVGKIASLRIKPRTARWVAQILKPGETLANIAAWADTVKDRVGKTDPDADTNRFFRTSRTMKRIVSGITTTCRSTAGTIRPATTLLLITTSFTC